MISEMHLAETDPEVTEPSLFFIGNATMLIRHSGFTILTDPNFVHRHEQVSIGYGMQATRLTEPAMAISELPPIDFVLLSHFHGDHFDQVAAAELAKDIPIVTNPEASEQLGELGFRNLVPLQTWDTLRLRKGEQAVTVTALPARHGPAVVDLVLPDVMGSLLRFEGRDRTLQQLYITGDTLMFDGLREIRERFPELDVMVLHLGGTRVLGVMVTMDGEQGVEALGLLRPRLAVPVHYDDYDVFASPLSDFSQRVEEAGLTELVRYIARGESVLL